MSKVFLSDIVDDSLRMHDCGEGNYWFYHKGSYPNDPPLLYESLINSATQSIEIWDPYFNVSPPHKNRDQDIFTSIGNDITLKILTTKGLDGTQSYLTEVHNSLKMKIPSSKNIRFGMRVFNKGDVANQGDWFFHDRLLIIDNMEVYLVGSSIGWHLKSNESTGIYKVESNKSKSFIRSIFAEYWKQADSHEIPIQFLH